MNVSATIMNVSSSRSATFSRRCTRGDDIRRKGLLCGRDRGVHEIRADGVAKLVPDGAHRFSPRLKLLGRQYRELAAARFDDALLVFLIDRFRALVAPLRDLGERGLEPCTQIFGKRFPELGVHRDVVTDVAVVAL